MKKKFVKKLNSECIEIKDSKEDVIFCVKHNSKDAKLVIAIAGNWELFSLIFSEDKYVNNTDESESSYSQAREMILNTAYNICNKDIKTRNAFIKGLSKLNEDGKNN